MVRFQFWKLTVSLRSYYLQQRGTKRKTRFFFFLRTLKREAVASAARERRVEGGTRWSADLADRAGVDWEWGWDRKDSRARREKHPRQRIITVKHGLGLPTVRVSLTTSRALAGPPRRRGGGRASHFTACDTNAADTPHPARPRFVSSLLSGRSPVAPRHDACEKRNSGGLETLFDSVKSHKVEIPSKKKEGLSDRTTVKGVINYIQKKMLKKNPEMFLKGENPSPSRTWEASNSDKSRTLVSLSHSSDPLLPSPELTSFFFPQSRACSSSPPHCNKRKTKARSSAQGSWS